VQDLTDSLQSTMVELYQLAGEMAPSEQDAIASSNLEGLLVFTRSLLEYLRESVRTLGMNADDTARSDFEKSFGLFSAEFVSEFVAGLELNTHSENFLSTERRKQFAYRLFVTVVPGLLYREDPALDYKIAMELDSSSFESVFTSLNQELRSKLQSAVVCEKTPTEAESILAKYAERLCIGRRMGLQRGSFSH